MAKFKTPEEKEAYWHSSSHIMADAVKRLFPKVKLAIGPAIDEGFYYDFDKEGGFTADDLAEIEKEIARIIKEKLDFKQVFKTRAEAKKILKDEPYKLELLNELEDEKISFFEHGKYMDMCIGPHVKNTGEIGVVKLLNTADAYWRGDSKRPILHRIYGISFPDKKLLDAYFRQKEEIAKRDHRKLGVALDLFSFHNDAPGMPFFHSKGMVIWNELIKLWRTEQAKQNYQEVKTPLILNKKLWLQSGHWDHYRENMYFTKIDEQEFAVKPMNCPGGILIFKSKAHSYRELPIKSAELGIVHRHELSGVLSGLLRVRSFTQDDAHIYCTEDQIEDEVLNVIELDKKIYSTFGFEYHVELSTRPENSMGAKEQWDKAEKMLENALKRAKLKYKINPGDGAFYGPKIDFHLMDAIGRTWQCGTIQLDFQMPEKFDLEYIGEDGKHHRPTMLHRTLFGSLERFIGILVEHYAGAFPLWFSPVQVAILTFTDRNKDFAEKVAKQLREEGIRIETDYRSATVQAKIRDAEVSKINYIVVIGDKEEEKSTLAVRPRGQKPKFGVKLEDFISDLKKEIDDKK